MAGRAENIYLACATVQKCVGFYAFLFIAKRISKKCQAGNSAEDGLLLRAESSL